jgi:hypothetical protein
MSDRLAVVVLGTRNSGKSTTWNRLFGAAVRTGRHERRLYLNRAQSVDVFVINASPEETETHVRDLLPDPLPPIVLCSVQYRDDAVDTFRYFLQNGYAVFVQWLNPGYSDSGRYADELGLRDFLLAKGATLQQHSGVRHLPRRVREIRQHRLGWGTYRNLVHTQFSV